jgi:Ser/Thr protein kinase RdoA (MazF antagonist)
MPGDGKFPNELGAIATRLLPALSDPNKDLTYMYDVNTQLNMPDVLCHGDLTRLNMMFDRETSQLTAIFDWQVCFSICRSS